MSEQRGTIEALAKGTIELAREVDDLRAQLASARTTAIKECAEFVARNDGNSPRYIADGLLSLTLTDEKGEA